MGYLGQTTREGFNYMTPTFVDVAGGNLSAQDMQLGADATTGSANIQVLDEEGLAPKTFNWYPKTSIVNFYSDYDHKNLIVVPEGKNGMWLLQKSERIAPKPPVTYYEVLDKDFEPSDAVQVWAKEKDMIVTTAGAVPDEDMLLSTIAGFNYFGNPFPVTISAQDFQLDEEATTGSANIQVLDEEGLAPKTFNWYPKTSIVNFYSDYDHKNLIVVPEGKKGMWLIQKSERIAPKPPVTYYEVLDKTLVAGEAIQLWAKEAEMEVTVTCPYDLKATK